MFDKLEREIEQRLAAAKAKQVLYRGHLSERMIEADKEQRQREAITARATSIANRIVRPRIEKLAQYFDNAVMSGRSESGDDRCVCRFGHTERFPATTKLEVSAQPEVEDKAILLKYRLEILPIFFEFDHEAELVVHVDAVDEQAVASWVETRLVEFLDTYLRLQEIDPYQQENLVTDPVCGMRFNKLSAAAEIAYGRRTFYFCVQECREKFVTEPTRYVSMVQ